MLKWVIQKNLIKTKVLQDFRDAFNQLDIDHEEVEVIPFSNELPLITPSQFNIFYGSTTLMLNAYTNQNYKLGVFYNPDKFSVSAYLKEWGKKMLNSDGQTLPFKEFITTLVSTKPAWFLRPNADDKSFAGMIMQTEDIIEWYNKVLTIDNPKLNENTLIFVSETKSIYKEWRNFIVDGKVIDSSRYMLNGELRISKEDCPNEMIDFVNHSASIYSPHDIFVMDVAQTSEGFKIIECNCFNGTGFYGHNIKTIVGSITERIKATQFLK